MTYPLRAVRTVRVIQVIEFMTVEGEGTKEEPVRRVRYYHTLDGKVLARSDDLEDGDILQRIPGT